MLPGLGGIDLGIGVGEREHDRLVAHLVDPLGLQHARGADADEDVCSDQINNVLAFPGVFRGLLDARARDITMEMLLRAADAIAHVVTDKELNASYIIPSVFDEKVPKAVAKAVQGVSE